MIRACFAFVLCLFLILITTLTIMLAYQLSSCPSILLFLHVVLSICCVCAYPIIMNSGLDHSLGQLNNLGPLLHAISANAGIDGALDTKRNELDASISSLIPKAMWAISILKAPIKGLHFSTNLNDFKAYLSSPMGNSANIPEDDYSWYVEVLQEVLDGLPVDQSENCEICEDMVDIYLETGHKPPKHYCKDLRDEKPVHERDAFYQRCRAMKDTLIDQIGRKRREVQRNLADFSCTKPRQICRELTGGRATCDTARALHADWRNEI